MDEEAAGELDIAIGAKLRQLRERAGLSGQRVADTLDVSQQLISYQELGRRQVSLAQLLKLTTLYQTTARQFLAELKLGSKLPLQFAEPQQATYHAESVENAQSLDRSDALHIDLTELAHPADRRTILELFQQLKREQNKRNR